ncbi:hypothetical protein C7974DRAFT_318086 [Boeremia exigua]|uniref:uncharacterized protein n=1 Tax=Boeremia exigua TaxID=749465 RepID=UPI001E8CA93A|nr:uncharacterized protein C7974DRAFT_318086 [Boeremia exigua]KAH6618839.1 hypothetical protein C7974DRAFT_318086 [Boeremia exigua]
MALRFIQQTLTVAALCSAALAQTSDVIPADISAGFTNKEVQVSFDAKAVDGFASGTTFSKDAVSTEPTFALGDSNGISPSTRYTLIMVDTTCTSARKLHYVRSNFKFSFAGGANIDTESAPLLEYKAPGALGEQGDARQYVFLMYTNPQRKEFAEMQLPADDQVFDIKQFQNDNGLKDPVAGVGMVVTLGGTADCGSEGANQVPSGLPSAAPASSAAASSVVSSAASSAAQTSPAPAPTPSPPGSPAAPSPPPSVPASPSPPTGPANTPPAPSSAPAAAPSPSVLPGTPTTSRAPLEQTANAAAGTVVAMGSGRFVTRLLVVAGVLVWWG